MTIDINQVLVLALFVNGREVVFSCIKAKVLWAQKCHWTVGSFLITHVPPDYCRINEWLFSTFFGIILPDVAEVCHHQALVGVNCCASSSSRACIVVNEQNGLILRHLKSNIHLTEELTSKKSSCYTTIIPRAFELPEVGLGKQITWFAAKHCIAVLVFCVDE